MSTYQIQLHYWEDATETSTLTFDTGNLSTYLWGDIIVFQIPDNKLEIAATDITNLVGATSIARYNYMITNFIGD